MWFRINSKQCQSRRRICAGTAVMQALYRSVGMDWQTESWATHNIDSTVWLIFNIRNSQCSCSYTATTSQWNQTQRQDYNSKYAGGNVNTSVQYRAVLVWYSDFLKIIFKQTPVAHFLFSMYLFLNWLLERFPAATVWRLVINTWKADMMTAVHTFRRHLNLNAAVNREDVGLVVFTPGK